MQVYLVGGAVRDELLGRPVADRDFVVVGETPEQMRALGFTPVGRDFPVFLHPDSKEEYALARTERKVGRGYRGFVVHASPEVSLMDDLARRDLTINAMARDRSGQLIDPFGGQRDLAAGVLRHISPAFAEDPLRVLRVARFAARFDFALAPETEALLRKMVASGELKSLVAERVWQELARALMEARPSRFFSVLRRCGALAEILPELDALFGVAQPPHYHPEIDAGVHVLQALDFAADENQPLEVRWALLAHDLGKADTPEALLPRHTQHEMRGVVRLEALQQRWRVPKSYAEIAAAVTRHHASIHRCREWRVETLIERLLLLDALRRPERFAQIVTACRIDVQSRLGRTNYPSEAYLLEARAQLAAVDLSTVLSDTPRERLPEAIARTRLEALRHWRETSAAALL